MSLLAAQAQLSEPGSDGIRRGAGERDGERSRGAGGSSSSNESHCEGVVAETRVRWR